MTDKEIREALASLLLIRFASTGQEISKDLRRRGVMFDPVGDKHTNLVIRDDFETVIDYIAHEVSIYGDLDGVWTALSTVSYTEKGTISRAVCLAVLEAHGQ